MPATLTPDLLAHLAAVRDGEPDDADLLVLADRVQEEGDEDRAELIRVQVELPRKLDCPGWCRHAPSECRGAWLQHRRTELLARNPAWSSVPCPECWGKGIVPNRRNPSGVGACPFCGPDTDGGTGDLLANAKPTLTRGFVSVTLPSALCWQRRCEVCGTSRWGRGDGCIHCDGACGPKVKYFPHPVLAAVLASPVGPWVRRVVVSDRKPLDYAGDDKGPWLWYDSRSEYVNWTDSHHIPGEVWDHVDLPIHDFTGGHCKVAPTATTARDALARAVPLWSRPLLEKP